MARTSRLVVPHLAHHVTQRGTRRQPIFFKTGDERLYLQILSEECDKAAVEIWAYCLMPNHVHLIATPSRENGLARAIGETHRQYAGLINRREKWTGHLFQDRFSSSVMDEQHLMAALRYVALNPVRAGLVARPQDWPWSSVHAHLLGRDGRLVRVAPLLERVEKVKDLFAPDPRIDARWAKEVDAIRAAAKGNEPVGAREFVAQLRKAAGAALAAAVSADRGQVARLREQPGP